MSIKRTSDAFINFIKTNPENDQYERFKAETEIEKVIHHLSIVERLYPDQVLMLCNRSHPALQFVGSNCSNIFGFNDNEFRNLGVMDFIERIHEDDVEHVKQCFDFMNNTEPYDPIAHRFVLHYRFRKKAGGYIHLRDEKLAIESDNGKYIYFTMFKNITVQEKFYHVKLDIYQVQKGNVLKVYSYNPRQARLGVTPRQQEIIKLIVKGFSTKEIADTLNLSINTVKNHKQALFRKVNVKSSVELINLTAHNGG
jgi:DNA-binding CsgD family transcriptional regulator